MWLGIWGFFSWIPAVLFIVIAFLLIRGIIKDMNSEGTDYLFSAIAFTALLMAAVVCFLNFIIKLSILLTYVLPIFVVLYLVFLLAVFLSHERVRANKLEEKLALEKDMSKMQTALFAAKMRPHFLYNSLSSIQELCYQDPEKAASLIVKFSNYLRTNIDFMDFTELIPFETELDNIYNYVYIQKERFGDSLRFYDKIDCTDFKVPPFIVQPLIENAINYGVRQSLEGGCVWLDVFDEKDHIIIEVRNEGEELREDQLRTNHSVDNIRKRLEILLEGSLTIAYDKEKRIVTVRIQIPKR